MNNKVLLEVKNLKKYFPLQKNLLGKPKVVLKAVDDVSFKLETGKTIGVVGESGCGKTTLGRTILQLYDTTGGKTLYYGHEIEDFLPSYYVKDVKKLNSLKVKLNSKIEKLNTFNELDSEFDKYLKFDTTLTIDDLNNIVNGLTKSVEELSNVSEEDKKTSEYKSKYASLKSLLKTYTDIVDILEKTSIATGGYILSKSNDVEVLLLNTIKSKNDLAKEKLLIKKLEYKLNHTADDELKNKLSESIEASKRKIDDIDENIKSLEKSLEIIKIDIEKSNLFNDLESRIETGIDLARLNKTEMRKLRTEIQLIFQDPYSSLPPRMTVGSIISEAVKVHKIVEADKVREHVNDIMEKCGLQQSYYVRYPHEFSGGQRQRICIARALAVKPKLVICDEPVSALDVSIQAQIINLLKDLQNEIGLTYMFISHDLSVVKYITDSIIVMYLGNMMEVGDTEDIFKNPLHPYTQALFSAVPVPDPDAKMQRIILQGDIPSPANPPKGCKFHTRCERCMSVCKLLKPEFIQHSENHVVACHLYNEEVMANLSYYDEELKRIEDAELALQNEDTKHEE